MTKLMKRMVVGVAVVGLMLSFPLPAMATVCQPTDVDCVEPPPQDPCAIPLQQGNAGDLQYADPNADVSGRDIQIDPSTEPTCDQTIPPPPQDNSGSGLDPNAIDYGGCWCPEEVIH